MTDTDLYDLDRDLTRRQTLVKAALAAREARRQAERRLAEAVAAEAAALAALNAEPEASGEADPPPAASAPPAAPPSAANASSTGRIEPPAEPLSRLGLTPADVGGPLAGPLASDGPPSVRPVRVGAEWYVNVAEAWSGDQPRRVTASLQLIVSRDRFGRLRPGVEVRPQATYPMLGDGHAVGYLGRLVLVEGEEYVMMGEECERRVTWEQSDALPLPGESGESGETPARPKRARKPRRAKEAPPQERPLTEREAEDAHNAAPPAPLSEERIAQTVEHATGGGAAPEGNVQEAGLFGPVERPAPTAQSEGA